MKIIAIYILKFVLKIIYFFMKLFKTKNKIVFISRQSNKIPLDFKLLKKEIEKRDINVEMVFLCKRIEGSIFNKLGYGFTILKQMHHLATSKIAIIDSYCIPVSVLKHKKSLYVLQIWHSIGKIKKSGYQTLDTKSGRSSKIAKAMCMHKNYDNIIAGGKAFNKYYCEGFNCSESILLNYGLPRIDYLLNNEEKIKNKIYKKYKNLKKKKIVLYVPTFRTYKTEGFETIKNEMKGKDFILIIKSHPNDNIEITGDNIVDIKEFKSIDLLTVADYVITDYSSIALEAIVLNKKILFYVYDHDKYLNNNGLNIDFYKVMSAYSSKDIKDIFKIIEKDKYDFKDYNNFKKKYLPKELGSSTKLITDLIISKLDSR